MRTLRLYSFLALFVISLAYGDENEKYTCDQQVTLCLLIKNINVPVMHVINKLRRSDCDLTYKDDTSLAYTVFEIRNLVRFLPEEQMLTELDGQVLTEPNPNQPSTRRLKCDNLKNTDFVISKTNSNSAESIVNVSDNEIKPEASSSPNKTTQTAAQTTGTSQVTPSSQALTTVSSILNTTAAPTTNVGPSTVGPRTTKISSLIGGDDYYSLENMIGSDESLKEEIPKSWGRTEPSTTKNLTLPSNVITNKRCGKRFKAKLNRLKSIINDVLDNIKLLNALHNITDGDIVEPYPAEETYSEIDLDDSSEYGMKSREQKVKDIEQTVSKIVEKLLDLKDRQNYT